MEIINVKINGDFQPFSQKEYQIYQVVMRHLEQMYDLGKAPMTDINQEWNKKFNILKERAAFITKEIAALKF
jgi:hypothetical protein